MDKVRETIKWLRELPAGCEIAWSDDCTRERSDLSYGFVDVYVPLLVEELGLNWIWSIFPTEADAEEEEAGRKTSLRPTSEVFVASNESAGGVEAEIEDLTLAEAAELLGIELDGDSPPTKCRIEPDEPNILDIELAYNATLEIAIKAGKQLAWARMTTDEGDTCEIPVDSIDRLGLIHSHAAFAREEGDLQVRTRRVWQLASLSTALERWCREEAGRGDLRFRFSDDVIDSPLVQEVLRRMADD